ncbi:MAG: hypothetical protein VW462_10680, partial [Rhodospirillales bacterium]
AMHVMKIVMKGTTNVTQGILNDGRNIQNVKRVVMSVRRGILIVKHDMQDGTQETINTLIAVNSY